MIAGLLLLAAAPVSHAAIITQFNFNSTTPDGTSTTGSLAPSIGTGSLNLIGGTTSTFASGSGSTDPASTDNTALNTTGYPTQGTGSGTAGVRFNVSTAGFTGISISFDLRQSNTASQYFQLQASTNGTTFTNVSGGTASILTQGSGNTATFSNTGLLSSTTTSNNFVQGITYTFAAGSIYENAAAFAFRLVAVFDPATTGSYTGAGRTTAGVASAYGTTGTVRFDMVTVNGTAGTTPPAVPEPASIAMVAVGVSGVVVLRRRTGSR